jgi:hydroxymethylpyrimidine pyrophosphatase-like HAD family hydrolase/hypoxanthine phosphoribosyltransferase
MIDNQPLLLSNLLNSFDELCSLLTQEVRLGRWLNAYLLAAGVNQVIEDHLHPDPLHMGKIAKTVARTNLPGRIFFGKAVQKVDDMIINLEYLRPQSIRLSQLQQRFANIVEELADILTGHMSATQRGLPHRIQVIINEIKKTAPQLSGHILRLPSCFRSFDQQPYDMKRLAQEFTARWPDRFRPLAIVGVRTSGSYLAPLCVSYLKRAGYREVTGLTFRPGHKLLRLERRIFETILSHGGMVLIVDDPPATGSSLMHTVREIEKAGIPNRSIVLMLQLFGPVKVLPPILQSYQAVLLPWENWNIHEKLSPVSIHMILDDLFSQEFSVNSVTRLPLAERKWVRSHIRALYEVNLTDLKSGCALDRKVFVEGAGLGYFGEHSLAIKSALCDYLPEVYGLREGLLFRAWLPEQNRVASTPGSWNKDFIKNLVGYVQKRHQVLVVPKDVSWQLKGENSSWEVASTLLSKAFGRGWMLARLFFVDGIARLLLEVNNPSVIDGKMDLDNWFFHDSGDSNVLKIGFSERDFSNLDLYSYDPVFDLAGLAVNWPVNDFSEVIRRTYQELSGDQVNPERWLLYQWIHLWDQQRLMRRIPEETTAALTRIFQGYFRQVYFSDIESTPDGPICALDVDGVLETTPLGFPHLTPTSALALRAFILHGFRPVLSTGRSLGEVRDRCRAYGLAGGVAEYGAVLYDHESRRVEELLSVADCRALDRLRNSLCEVRDVYIDKNFQYAVRAYRKGPNGNHLSLSPDDVSLALEKSQLELPVRIIPGQRQTDFMVASIDKGTGLRCLMKELGHPFLPENEGLAFAIGDTESDLPMFSLARKAYVPGHADSRFATHGVQRMAKPYQSGLAQAAESFLGHKPGACPVCKWSPQSRQRELFLRLLSSQEGRTWGMVVGALKLSAMAKR